MIALQFTFAMKQLAVTVLFLSIAACLFAEDALPYGKSISVKFVVDGQPVKCKGLSIDLAMDGKHFVPTRTPTGFIVPPMFLHAYVSKDLRTKEKVGAKIKCDAYTVEFSGLYPARVLPGGWEAGISYPTSWFDGGSPVSAPEQDTWVSYLVTECNGCDPGFVVSQSHPDPPQSVIARLREEQPHDTGERARDVAYALAVFNSEYQANRDFLVKMLQSCLSKPRNSPEEGGCDGTLVDALANLYWRGDKGLSQTLFAIADRREDVIDKVGRFYANLLDRRMIAALEELRKLAVDKQNEACEMAFKDDLRFDSPKLERVLASLRQSNDMIAQACFEKLKSAREPQ